MLTASALASAMPVVANLEARGLMVRPISGTPLDSLFKASYYDMDIAWPTGMFDNGSGRIVDDNNRFDVDLSVLAQQTNSPSTITGYCEQDICMKEIAGAAAQAVISHLQFARTVVAPAIEAFVNQINEPLQYAMANSLGDMEVMVTKLPAPLLESAVTSAIGKAKNIAGESFPFDLKLPRMDEVAITDLMKSGSPSVDQAIDDWLEQLPSGFVEEVWNTVFTSNAAFTGDTPPNSDSFFGRSEDGLNAALLAFLVARRIWDKPIDNTEMKLDDYQNKMAFIRDQAALRLNGELQMNDRNEKYGTLIRSHGRGKVSVNDVVYRKFLSEGGSNEVLFGNALLGRPSLSSEDIMASKEECVKAWQSYLAFNRTSLANKRFTAVKSLVRMEFSSFVANANNDELPVNMRAGVVSRFEEAMERTTQSETEQLYPWIQRLLCSSLYYRTDAGMILDQIDQVMKSNEGMDVREAAVVAAVDYTATWVGRMLQVLPAKM